MKKFYILLTAVLLCLPTFAQDVKTVPYSSTMCGPVGSNVSFIDGWRQIDANDDNKIWSPKSDSDGISSGLSAYAVRYEYGSNPANDFLVSPAIQFEAGKEYKVMFWYRSQSSSYLESFDVYASTEDSAEKILEGTKIGSFPEVKNTSSQKGFLDFTPEESGEYHIVFHCNSARDRYYLYIKDFSVVENAFAPSPVSNLTATRGENHALTCTLTWTLPTTDVFGSPFGEDKAIEKVEIFRDGGETAIATLAGDATSFTDTEETGLTSGFHTYTVVVTADGATSTATVGPTSYVGPVVPSTVPTQITFYNNPDAFDIWSTARGETNNSYQWAYNSSEGCLVYIRSYNSNEDDWLISPPLQFDEPGAYQICFDSKKDNESDYTLECYFGASSDTTAMELRMKSLPLSRTRKWNQYYVNVTEPGTYYAALHAASPTGQMQRYYLYGFKVEEALIMPQPVTNLKATPIGLENKVKISFFLSDKANTDEAIAADNVTVKIYQVGEEETLVKTLSGSELTLGAVNEVEIPVDEAGVFTYRVVTYNADGASYDAEAHPSVQTSWIGDRLVALPYSIDLGAQTHQLDETVNIWDIIDGNADGKTWSQQTYYGFRCAYPTAVDGLQYYDDYLLTPYFELEPGYYLINYKVSGGDTSAKQWYNIGYTPASTYDATNKPVLTDAKQLYVDSGSTSVDCLYTIKIETKGRYQIVFAATEPNASISADYRSLSVKEFAIRYTEVLPGIASDITITPDADKELKATISWTNPSNTNIEGLDLDEITKALILRDGEVIATVTEGLVPGATASYVDDTIEQAGSHFYSVEIYNANGKSETAAATVASPWIGRGLQTPYTANTYNAFSQWTIYNANEDVNSYNEPVTWVVTENKDYAALTSTSKDADDWFISPIIDIKPKSIYKIEVRMRQSSSSSYGTYDSPFQLRVGNDDNYTAYTKAGSFTLSKNSVPGNEQTAVFYVRSYANAVTAAEGDAEEGTEEDVQSLAKFINGGEVHFALRCIGRADLHLESFTISFVKEAEGDDPVPGEHICQGQALPYSADVCSVEGLSTFYLTEGWTSVDANADGTTWTAQGDGTDGAVMYYRWHGSNPGDDFLISPLFHFSAGKEYKIISNFRAQTAGKMERIKIYASESDDPTDIKDSYLLSTYENFPNVYNDYVCTFTPSEDIDAHIAIQACSDKDLYGLFYRHINIIENVFAPKPVSYLYAEVAPLRELKVTLSWMLPTQSVFNDPFTEDQTIEKVEIFRDGGETAIATLTGDATSFEDTPETGLTSGKHTYTVTVTVAGVEASAQVGPTSYVGPVEPTEVPADFVVTSSDSELWTLYHDENSTNTSGWYLYSPSSSYTPAFRIDIWMNDVVKDWLISPPLSIAEPGYYRVTVKARNTDGVTPLLGYVGTGMDVEEMQLCTSLPLTTTESTQCFDFYASEAGTYYAALLSDYTAPKANAYYVYSLGVDNSEFVPAAVTDASAAGDGNENAVVLTWKNPATDFGGQPISGESYKLEIYRDDVLIKTIEGTELLTDGSLNTYRDEVPASGVYTYTFKTLTQDGVYSPSTVTLTTGWIGSKVVALPYEFDFSNADETRQIWEIVDANNDGSTWKDSSYAGITVDGRQDTSTSPSQYVINDYLLSPSFNLEPGYYKFSYELRGGYSSSWSGDTEVPYTVGCFVAGTFNPEAPEYVASQTGTTKTSSFGDYFEFLFEITEAGEYQISIGTNSSIEYSSYYSSYFNLTVRGVKMEQTFILPQAATDLTVIPADDQVLQATVTWTNPTGTNLEGNVLADGDIVKAVIIRDGEEIATVTEDLVPGATSTFVDNTLTQAGPHKYSVDIYNVNGKNEEASPVVTSDWIGGDLTVPYQASSADDFRLWTIVNADNDTNSYGEAITWAVYQSSSNEYIHITCTSKVADDWIITPGIVLEPATIYEVTIKNCFYSATSYYAFPDQTLQVGVSETGDHTDMQNIYTIEMDVNTSLNSPKTDTFLLLTPGSEPGISTAAFDDYGNPVDEETKVNITDGTKYFGIHSGAQGDICIRHFGITKMGSTTGVDGVFAKDGVVFANGKLTFEGKADVNVFNVAGTLVASEQGVESTFSLDDLANGVYMVNLTFENGNTTVLKVVK